MVVAGTCPEIGIHISLCSRSLCIIGLHVDIILLLLYYVLLLLLHCSEMRTCMYAIL